MYLFESTVVACWMLKRALKGKWMHDHESIVACYLRWHPGLQRHRQDYRMLHLCAAPGTSSICLSSVVFFVKQKRQNYALPSNWTTSYTCMYFRKLGYKIWSICTGFLCYIHLHSNERKDPNNSQVPSKIDIWILLRSTFKPIVIPPCETILRALPVMMSFNVKITPNDSLALSYSLSRSLQIEIFRNISKSYENSKMTEHGSLTWDEWRHQWLLPPPPEPSSDKSTFCSIY